MNQQPFKIEEVKIKVIWKISLVIRSADLEEITKHVRVLIIWQ